MVGLSTIFIIPQHVVLDGRKYVSGGECLSLESRTGQRGFHGRGGGNDRSVFEYGTCLQCSGPGNQRGLEIATVDGAKCNAGTQYAVSTFLMITRYSSTGKRLLLTDKISRLGRR